MDCAGAEKFPHPHIEWFLLNSAGNNNFPPPEHTRVDGKGARPKKKNGCENSDGEHHRIAREQISQTERNENSYQWRKEPGYQQASDRERRHAANRFQGGSGFGKGERALDEQRDRQRSPQHEQRHAKTATGVNRKQRSQQIFLSFTESARILNPSVMNKPEKRIA
jgi:hypothetical protein